MYRQLERLEALKEAKGFNDGGSIKIGAQDFRDLAYIVSGEAARGTNDEYGVSAVVLNRVASPVWIKVQSSKLDLSQDNLKQFIPVRQRMNQNWQKNLHHLKVKHPLLLR